MTNESMVPDIWLELKIVKIKNSRYLPSMLQSAHVKNRVNGNKFQRFSVKDVQGKPKSKKVVKGCQQELRGLQHTANDAPVIFWG